MRKPIALAFLLSALPVGAAIAADQTPTLSITGKGQISAVPDMATVLLSVSNEGATAREALSANSASMGAVMDRLKVAGIEERLIQTSGLTVSPRWDHGRNDGRPPRITGYVAANQVTARVEDLEKLGRILDDAVSDGANGLGGISFGLKDPAPAMAEARRLSVLDAIEQAELYADAAGVKLLRITGITPQAGFRPAPMMAARSMAAEMVDAVPVSGGEIETRAEVTITWEIGEAG